MKKIVLIILSILPLFAAAQPPGWTYVQPITITNPGSTMVLNYQLPVIINTQVLITANQMQATGADIRFGKTCNSTTFIPHYIDTGINTTATRIWIGVDTLLPLASKTIYMYYGNASTTTTSTPSIFNGPFSATNQISGGTTNLVPGVCQRGFRFSPNTDILITQFGKNEPNGTQRYITLFNYTTQAILSQIQVSGAASTYTYGNLPTNLWLTSGTQYVLQLFTSATDGYYYQSSTQINSNLTYFDMQYSNGGTQNTFPNLNLAGLHYGYGDFNFYTRNIVTPAPTYLFGAAASGTLASQPTDTSICVGKSVFFAVTANGTPSAYQWQVNTGSGWVNVTNGGAYSGATTGVLTVSNVTLTMSGYQYRVTVAGGCGGNIISNMATLTVTNATPPPAPVAGSNSPVCAGFPINLTASTIPNATYYWSGPSYSVTGQNPVIANAAAANAGTYSVFAMVNSCPSTSSTVSVSVLPSPVAPTAATTAIYCQYDAATPLVGSAGTGNSIRWYAPPNYVSSTTAPTPSTAVAGTFLFYATQISANGCESPRTTITVTIKPHPVPPVLPGNGTISFCQYELGTQVSATGSNLLWYPTPTGGIGTATAPYAPANVPGTLHYYVTQTINGCEGDRGNLTVIINPKPAPPVVVSPLKLCQFDAVNLSATGQNLRWYNAPTGGAGIPFISVNTGYVDSFKYYVTQTVNGCESDRKVLQVYVSVKPNGIIGASTHSLCQGDTLDFYYYGNALDSYIYNWNSPQPSVEYVKGVENGKGPYTLRFDSAGVQTVTVQVNNNGCLSSIADYDVTVKAQPYLSFAGPKEACVNEVINIALNGISPRIQKFTWDFGGATTIYGGTDGGPYGISYPNAGNQVVGVFATTNGCPSKLYTDTIVVHPLPDPTIHHDPTDNGPLCTGDSVRLFVQDVEEQRYKWTPVQFFREHTDSAASVYARPSGATYVYVKVTTKFNCSSEDSILLNAQPCCGVYFASAFSPNNDSKNDYFHPISAGHHQVETFRIINRWGQVIYESRDEGQKGWDGTFNGKPQDMGTYYYYYHYKCTNGEDMEQKGEFLLMR